MENEKIHTKQELIDAIFKGLNTKGTYSIHDINYLAEKLYQTNFEKPELIPFDLGLYETGKYDCVTREGRSARFLSKINSINDPLVFVITNKIGEENAFTYSIYGRINFMSNKFNSEGSPNDIFLIPKS